MYLETIPPGNDKLINYSDLLQLPPLVGLEEEALEVEHLRAVALVDPLVLVLLPGGDVPAPVLRVVGVQVGRNEAAKILFSKWLFHCQNMYIYDINIFFYIRIRR